MFPEDSPGAPQAASIREAQFLAAIVESSEDAIIGESLEGIITSWNRGAEKMFGYSSKEAIGQSVSILHSPGDSEELARILELIRESKCASHFETTRRRRDGTRIDVSVSVSSVYGEDGEVVGGAKIIRDITDRRRSEEVLRKTEQLGIAGRLAASVAHEINNPLAALTNLLYLMRSEELSPLGVEYLKTAEEELARVSQIATQALGFYKENAAPSTFDLLLLLEEALALHRNRIEANGISIVKRCQPVRIVCHGGELKQVFVNLIGNAVEAIQGSGTLALRLRAGVNFPAQTPGVRITIADTGRGVNAETQSHLFEPFFTTKGPTRTGLGLWVCKEIVRRHRGKIAMRSRAGYGTVISLCLPARGEGSGHLSPSK